jgi:pentose-5-phosphate-3-epimerase
MHGVIDMMTKSVKASVNLLLKTLLHSVKCIINLLPICLKMGVEPGLHLLKLGIHRMLNIREI